MIELYDPDSGKSKTGLVLKGHQMSSPRTMESLKHDKSSWFWPKHGVQEQRGKETYGYLCPPKILHN